MLDDNPNLAEYTTLRLGGPARSTRVATTTDELITAITDADSAKEPTLLIAGGSNLVIGDKGFDGTAILLRSRGVTTERDGDDVLVTAQAGHPWDEFVAETVASGWSGVECLSGIPGSTGATPVQNVGAYGQEIREVFEHADVYDRRTRTIVRMTGEECRFAYRHSVFKHNDRYVVLAVTYRLREERRSRPIRYAETARSLGVEVGDTVDLAIARDTVLALRRGKGMVLDPGDRDTYSVGSFFINPVITVDAFDALVARCGETPSHHPFDGDVKVSAAWLIGRAGFEKGHGHDGVSISTKHTLALTNRGGGTTAALMALAAEVRDGVLRRLGVELFPEPVLVGVDW
ncbi:UDP-N-acetylmuramate dehydrogenase [Stackebrandtia soli]|uniref:UDP-N-acetylmuramate dehydrogenase n=1 Tax=Stackebrandtia soli TaxID=1892856 RepID=UPI0039EA2CA4